VLVDKYGEVQTVKTPVLPYAAVDSRGNDCLGQVSVTDQVTYDFDESPDTANHCLNNLTLSFMSDTKPDSCKILVTGHNSLWIDHIVKQIFERLGRNYPILAKIMEFTLPGNITSASTFFLHSKGYYHQVTEKNGQSEFAFIWDFLNPGRLSEWSYENYKSSLDAHYALRENLSKPE
jgi:hypothetical protein